MEENSRTNIWMIIVGLVSALILAQILIRMRFFGLILLAAILIGLSIFWIYHNIQRNQNLKQYSNSIEGQLEEKIQVCEVELNKHQKVATSIKAAIHEIEDHLDGNTDVDPKIKDDSERLLKKYHQELKIRTSKINFFDTCLQKLRKLINNHLIAEKLLEKEAELRELKGDHYEDLGKMEEIKSNIELDTFYLETIEELSQRIDLSNDFDDTEQINNELLKITKDISF